MESQATGAIGSGQCKKVCGKHASAIKILFMVSALGYSVKDFSQSVDSLFSPHIMRALS
jgi:hypothetical protein